MGMKKTRSLKTAFWKFLLMLLLGLLLSVLIPLLLLLSGAAFGILNYADYSEQNVKYIAPIVASAPDLSEVQMPAGCRYLVLDKNYKMIESTLDEKDLAGAMDYAATGKVKEPVNKRYLLVTRENEIVILQYYIGSQFTAEWMRKHLPSPEILLCTLIGLNCIAVCIFLTTKFSKRLCSQLEPLFSATQEVAGQNLDFEVGHSEIKEFEDVLLSFSNMKESLKTSLEQQWQAEKIQKEQIAALAHDLKTPLTVIQGNIDLLTETNLDDEQKLYSGYITDSSEQMQTYIRTLIEISRASVGYRICKRTCDTTEFIKEVEAQMWALFHAKGKRLKVESSCLPNQICIDKILLQRAISNIVNNALDYAKENGIVKMKFTNEKGIMQITVTDDGKGFSGEALRHGKEQFYMGNQSRNSKMHFGMGLYIASCIAQQHGGKMELMNSAETGGAMVTIYIPQNL